MPLVTTLQALRAVRTDRQAVLTTMSAAREWMRLQPPVVHPLDLIYAPSAMGQLPAYGLGLALAQPDKQIIIFNGDGCMLMNLGVLTSITAAAPPNYVLIVIDNGVYEVTGHQLTVASPNARRGAGVDWPTVARGCGFQSVFSFSELADWQAQLPEVLAARGPTFVCARVQPMPGGEVPKSPAYPPDRIAAFAKAMQRSV